MTKTTHCSVSSVGFPRSMQVLSSEHVCGGAQGSEESESVCSSFSTPLMPKVSSFVSDQTLNLSPSLLTSPTRGVSHDLLPQGQEDLQSKSLISACLK